MFKETITRIIEETAQELGYSIYESSLFLKGENSRVIVRIDAERIISHRDCEMYSIELSRRLEDAALLPNFSLEVSSPGLKRQIRNPDEFKRFLDKPVKIIHTQNGESRVTKGLLMDAGDAEVVVETEKGEETILYSEITQSNLDF